MSGGFKRSGAFGLVGVFVVAAVAVVIALTMGQGEANPKLALGLIFGVIAIFCAALLALQRSDLERAAGSGAAASNRAAAEGGKQVDNPTTIGAAALYGAFRAIGPGGEIGQGYERTDRAMKPLGLQVSERPRGGFEMRMPATPGFDYRLRGWTVLSGERHGRQVAVRLGGHEDAGSSEIHVSGAVPEFGARSSDGRVRSQDGAPAALAAVLATIPNSTRWKRLEVSGGAEGIVLVRRKGDRRDWLCDLWLAERLASI